jgi:transposase-like protein
MTSKVVYYTARLSRYRLAICRKPSLTFPEEESKAISSGEMRIFHTRSLNMSEVNQTLKAKSVKRKYTAQTRADAISQVLTAGLSVPKVAQTYEMPIQTLDKWVRQAKLGQSGSAKPRDVDAQAAEIAKLRAANALLTMERDILKKATAYFAKDLL